MIYFRVALHGSQSTAWRWKSPPLTSLHQVLSVLKLYHCMPREQLRVFVSTSPERMETMLSRENQRLLSTAVTVEQLWDQHRTSEIEVRCLEIEVGRVGDHDAPYSGNVPISEPYLLAWTKLLCKRERGELVLE